MGFYYFLYGLLLLSLYKIVERRGLSKLQQPKIVPWLANVKHFTLLFRKISSPNFSLLQSYHDFLIFAFFQVSNRSSLFMNVTFNVNFNYFD